MESKNPKQEIQSLSNLCINHIARTLNYKTQGNILQYLPFHIKNDILNVATKVYHRICDNQILNALLNIKLRKLDLSMSTTDDASLYIIGQKCPNLEILILDGKCSSFSKKALNDCIPKLKKLQELKLKNCDNVDNDLIMNISNSCQFINLLDLSNCIQVTDDSFMGLEKLNLIALDLSGTGITDVFLKKFEASKLSDILVDINLCNCNITSDGLKALPWGQLKYVGILGCNLNNLDFISNYKELQYLQFSIPF